MSKIKVDVHFQYYIDYDKDKNLVVISGPQSETDPKMNEHSNEIYFNGNEFFDGPKLDDEPVRGIIYDEGMIDTPVVQMAKAVWNKKNPKHDEEYHDIPSNDSKGKG